MWMTKKLNVIIMAAGKGTRMSSELPKVLHKILGRPLLHHVIDQANFFKPSEIAIIVGFKKDLVQKDTVGKFTFITQEPQMGTGHAIQECLKQAPHLFENADVIVLVRVHAFRSTIRFGVFKNKTKELFIIHDCKTWTPIWSNSWLSFRSYWTKFCCQWNKRTQRL